MRARQEPRETQWLVGAMRHAGTPQGDEDIEGVQLGTLTSLCRTNRSACVHLGTCCSPLASEKSLSDFQGIDVANSYEE